MDLICHVDMRLKGITKNINSDVIKLRGAGTIALEDKEGDPLQNYVYGENELSEMVDNALKQTDVNNDGFIEYHELRQASAD
ncbi:unnamed protein product [Arctia plantaginis]|uniref:EF-hand domain-containing protein n=1 Tax=Arctia plantaginis TaxID=874455 RepID=A0A8S1AKN5_ARCPL|nr:unnamed protein product [Arctia plantaginis]